MAACLLICIGMGSQSSSKEPAWLWLPRADCLTFLAGGGAHRLTFLRAADADCRSFDLSH